MASNFTNTTENGGISIAKASSTSWGVSASVSGFAGAASAGASGGTSDAQVINGGSKSPRPPSAREAYGRAEGPVFVFVSSHR